MYCFTYRRNWYRRSLEWITRYIIYKRHSYYRWSSWLLAVNNWYSLHLISIDLVSNWWSRYCRSCVIWKYFFPYFEKWLPSYIMYSWNARMHWDSFFITKHHFWYISRLMVIKWYKNKFFRIFWRFLCQMHCFSTWKSWWSPCWSKFTRYSIYLRCHRKSRPSWLFSVSYIKS